MNTRFLVLTLFLIACKTSIAQVSSMDLPDYHPVSPNAASLGNYGLYPVNKNLGNTSISIPIYTISENKLNLPINLSYKSSGIRLNDLASWVGLGWSLNAGGAIIRNVKGLPDKTYNSDIPNLQNFAFNQANYDYMVGTTNGLSDTAPDQYVLNALGRSATFYFNKDNNNIYKAVFEDGTPIKIVVISANEMHAVFEDGTLLKFGKDANNTLAVEETKHSNPNYTSNYISAWYLTELISKDRQDTISFKYKSQGLLDGYCAPSNESIYIDNSFTIANSSLLLKASYQELIKTSRQFLEKIEFSNGYVDLESSLTRDDLSLDYKLDAVKIYFNDGSPNGKLIDEYHFTYNYFLRSGGVFSRDYALSPIFFSTDKQKDSREKSLKLLSVYRGASSSLGEVHSFDYNSTVLPIRCTTAQDSWGYCNTNAGTLLPQTTTSITGIDTKYYTVGNGNRSANETKMKAAVLEKVTYPTGGHTIFEHEANRFSTTEQAYTHKVKSAKAFGTECNGDPFYLNYQEFTFTVPTGSKNIKLSIDLSPVTHQGSGVTSYISLDSKTWYRPTPNSSGGPSDSSDGWNTTLDIPFGYNLGTPLSPVYFQAGTHTIKAYDTGYGPFAAYNCSRMEIRITWDEPSGTQQVEKLIGGLRIKSISNYDGASSTPVSAKKYEYINANLIHPERNRGYVRKIFTFDGGKNGDVTGIPPVAGGGGSNPPWAILCSSVSTSAHFNNNLGGEPAIEYGTVTEYDYDPVTGNKKGKVISNYQNVSVSRVLNSITGTNSYKHPQFMWSTFFTANVFAGQAIVQDLILNAVDGIEEFSFYETSSWKRGKLLNEETYKRNGSSDVLIAKVENIYETIESPKIYNNFVFSPFDTPEEFWSMTNPYNIIYDLNSIQYSYQVGETQLGRKVLKQSKRTAYDDAGLNPLVSTTDYFYDNLVHKQVTRTQTTNSEDKVIESKTLYADDIKTASTLQDNSSIPGGSLSPGEFNAVKKLQAPTSSNTTGLHRIVEPIQVETTVKKSDGTLLSNTIQRTNYHEPYSNVVVPKDIQTSKGGATLENRIVYEEYYDNGNVEEVSKADGSSVYYIWGYNEQYPIAKIDNFTSAQATSIQTQITAAINASNADIDSGTEDTLRTALEAIRAHNLLANAMVITYTYDPLIGITSTTDPKGSTTYYEHDDFNRLEYVKDGDGKILSKNKYHYKGQQ